MRTLIQDMRFALRLLSGSPGFALAAILTLALGMAPTTTVFSWIDSLLLHPFPGATHSDDLAVLQMSIPSAPNGGTLMSWLDYTDYRDHLTVLSGLAVQRECAFAVGDTDRARLTWGELVSANYFDVLGVKPVLGRMFVGGERGDTPGAYPVAVIGERLWRSYFHADRKIIGKPVRVNRHELTVVGVAPARFHGTAPAMLLDLWVPASMGAELGLLGKSAFGDRGYRDFNSMVARLKPGVSIPRAHAEVASLAVQFSAAWPKTNRGVSATIDPPWAERNGVGDLLRSPLRILMAVSMVLLLVVCANVANLLLARSVGRYREFGIRLALGASRWSIMRQLMTETAVLAAAASGVAILLLFWMSGSLIALVPNVGLSLVTELDLNFRIFGFTALCCVVAALVAGAAPALFSIRAGLSEVLKDGSRGSTQGARSRRMRGLLVITEIALAAIALVGAGLFFRSFRNAQAIHPGFDTANVLFGRFFLESTGYSGQQEEQFAIRLRQKLETAPGIQAVSYSDFTPLSTTAGPYDNLLPEGYVPAPGEALTVNRALVAPGYFALLHIPLIEGRDFTEQDGSKAPPVMIVNQEFARRYFRGANPVGRRVRMFDKWFTIAGLARDSKYFSPVEPSRPFFYLAFRQFYGGSHELYFFMRSVREPEQMIPTLRRAVTDTDPAASAFHAVPLAEYTQVALFPQKVAASLMGTLGLMCLMLAALGLYSVMSYSVSQRTQEIGIRMAMGAKPADVVRMVVGQGMALALAGLAVGLAAALAVTRLIASTLVNVDAADPATFAAAGLFLALVALLATWLPAHRATRIEPTVALRQQ